MKLAAVALALAGCWRVDPAPSTPDGAAIPDAAADGAPVEREACNDEDDEADGQTDEGWGERYIRRGFANLDDWRDRVGIARTDADGFIEVFLGGHDPSHDEIGAAQVRSWLRDRMPGRMDPFEMLDTAESEDDAMRLTVRAQRIGGELQAGSAANPRALVRAMDVDLQRLALVTVRNRTPAGDAPFGTFTVHSVSCAGGRLPELTHAVRAASWP